LSNAEETRAAVDRVLLLDDNDATRLTLAALLEEEGFTITEASSLAEARRYLAEGAVFDLVLLDRQLEDGQGTDLIPQVRAQLPGCSAIVVSGSEDRHARGAVTEYADASFNKGDDPGQLLEKMHAIMARRRREH
jgi:two-component system response regulator RegA